MSVSSARKRKRLRVVIGSVYLAAMVLLYGSGREVVWWFWMWPLAIAVFLYKLILWFGRCPACGEEFSLRPAAQGALLTTFVCRNCGEKRERMNMGGGPGGGGP